MVRAVGDATENRAHERTDAGAMRSLMDIIKKEETAVVVNIDERIQVHDLVQFLHACTCVRAFIAM